MKGLLNSNASPVVNDRTAQYVNIKAERLICMLVKSYIMNKNIVDNDTQLVTGIITGTRTELKFHIIPTI